MTKSIATLQDLQKIDPTIQEINNPHKEIPNISEDDDSRTVICVYVGNHNDNKLFCDVMVNSKIIGFIWEEGKQFINNKEHILYHGCIYHDPKSKIGLMKSTYEMYNVVDRNFMFFVCDTNKAEQIVKVIYGIDVLYYEVFGFALLLLIAYAIVLFELFGGV
ncbi:MAG: hypothetical protein WC929_00495 [Bacilli bacterium]|jgi:hypothetical protein